MCQLYISITELYFYIYLLHCWLIALYVIHIFNNSLLILNQDFPVVCKNDDIFLVITIVISEVLIVIC